jgi:bacteriocin biosynthesis cyclodehydratase domain-containing protein
VIRAYPVQLVNDAGRVFICRGRTQIKIEGELASELVSQLFSRLVQGACTREQLVASFPEGVRKTIASLVDQLLARRILLQCETDEPESVVPEPEIDVFYWQFGLRRSEVAERLREVDLAIIGEDLIAQQLLTSLLAAGFDNCKVIADTVDQESLPQSRPDELAVCKPLSVGDWIIASERSAKRCIVATSDTADTSGLRTWNAVCVARGVNFFPVLLRDLIAYAGPLTVPGQTACFECLTLRQHANAPDLKVARVLDHARGDGQQVVGFHPLMAQLAGMAAALELLKFYAGIPRARVGEVVEISALGATMIPRKVLRIPRCPVCGSVHRRPAIALEASFHARTHEST